MGWRGGDLRRAACAQGDSSAAVRWVVGGLLEGGDGGFVHAPLNFYWCAGSELQCDYNKFFSPLSPLSSLSHGAWYYYCY